LMRSSRLSIASRSSAQKNNKVQICTMFSNYLTYTHSLWCGEILLLKFMFVMADKYPNIPLWFQLVIAYPTDGITSFILLLTLPMWKWERLLNYSWSFDIKLGLVSQATREQIAVTDGEKLRTAHHYTK
jgi:hypothetical protein